MNLSGISGNLNFSVLADALLSVVPALVCIIVHELSHGAVAYALGDRTARDLGRLTLNPLRHLDVIGLLSMMFVGFGWAKPVPVNPENFKSPKRGMALTALAGPASNVLLAVLFLFLYGFAYVPLGSTEAGRAALEMANRIAVFSVSLAVFNILPIPLMDGAKVFFSIASDETYFKVMRYERYGLILILLLSLSGRLWGPLGAAVGYVYDKLFFFARAGYELSRLAG